MAQPSDVTAPGEARANTVKAVTNVSLSASRAETVMEGFYLLCVISNIKVLETLDKQLGTFRRPESKTKNKLIFSTEVL